MEREGVIHFEAVHTDARLEASLDAVIASMSGWRAVMMKLGFVGVDPARYSGVGFGNLSVRVPPFRGPRGQASAFLVTATQLGEKPALGAADVCVVDSWDLRRNRVVSRGRALPSSESLTHGAVYDVVPHARAVIHAHAPAIFGRAAALQLPTTRPDVGYGTVEMANEVARLWTHGALRDVRVFAMGGHEDGVVAIGDDLDEAGARLLAVLARALA